jgi:hypothetical protein
MRLAATQNNQLNSSGTLKEPEKLQTDFEVPLFSTGLFSLSISDFRLPIWGNEEP